MFGCEDVADTVQYLRTVVADESSGMKEKDPE